MQGNEQSEVQERLDAISRALARLSRRVEELESRLNRVEQPAATPPPLPPWPERDNAAAPVVQEEQWSMQPAQSTVPAETSDPGRQKAPPTAESVESSFGLAWMNRIGVVTLVLGVAFLFKYAADNQWIGPWLRVALGALAGLAALVLADRLHRSAQRVFAMGITGLGISVLYVSCYAAYGFYQLAPLLASFAGMVLTTAAAAWLALRYEAAAIAVLSLIGGFLTPLVLSTGRDAPWVLFPYLLMLIAGAVLLRRSRGWAAVEWLALLAGAAIYAAWFADHFAPAKRVPAAFFPIGAYALFLLSPSSAVRQLAQFGAGVSTAFVFRPESALLFAVLLPLAAVGLLRDMPAAVAAGFWIPYWIHAASLEAGEDFFVRFAGVACGFALLHGWLLWWGRRRADSRNWTLAAVYAANAVVWYAASYALLEPGRHAWTGAFTLAAAVVFAAAAGIVRRMEALALESGVLSVAFLTLAIPIQFGAWRVSVAWILEAVLLAFLASRFQARLPHWIAAAVLMLGLCRTVFADVSMTVERMFVNTRFFVMLWAALGCWISALMLSPRSLAAASYIAGHLMMLAGVELEILGQIQRTAASEDVRNASIVAFSLVLAGYGFALVALGVFRQTRLDRALGLMALGFVVVKLYLYDVWQLGKLLRSAAFVGLGLLLVAASYLYSRHRERLSRWIR
jgi:uncharacterized membrane protein